jgi:ketosteroid isomerase-like protein
MPARGEHDDFETAQTIVQTGLAALAAGDWETGRSLVHEDAEHVTRDGVFFGPERMISEFAPQHERWTISFFLEELVDAGGGALVLLLEVERRNPSTGKVGWKAWPAIVVRISDGKVAYIEGYIDRRKALDDLGVPRRP